MEPAILPKKVFKQKFWSPIPQAFWESDTDDDDDDNILTNHPIGLVQEGKNLDVNQSFNSESINAEDDNMHTSTEGSVHGDEENMDINSFIAEQIHKLSPSSSSKSAVIESQDDAVMKVTEDLYIDPQPGPSGELHNNLVRQFDPLVSEDSGDNMVGDNGDSQVVITLYW